MKLMYLGSAASEGWPAMFCECDVCKEAAIRGGRDIRMRTGSMLNDEILIDLTPDLMAQKLKFNLPLSDIRHCFLTHTHEDHFDARNMIWFAPGFANIANREARGKFHIYASEASKPVIEKQLYEVQPKADELCEITYLKLYERVEAKGVGFTPIPATHGCVGAVNYIIDQDGKFMLYAHDTGLWEDEVWEFMKGYRFDLVSLDCTNGPLDSKYSGHMGFGRNLTVKKRFEECGISDANTRYVLNHFSHNGGMLYDEMVSEMTPRGFEIGFDGKVMKI